MLRAEWPPDRLGSECVLAGSSASAWARSAGLIVLRVLSDPLCVEVVIAWLGGAHPSTAFRSALGGITTAAWSTRFANRGNVAGAIGLELSDEVVASSPFVSEEQLSARASPMDGAPRTTRIDGSTSCFCTTCSNLAGVRPRARPDGRSVRRCATDGFAFIYFPPHYSASAVISISHGTCAVGLRSYPLRACVFQCVWGDPRQRIAGRLTDSRRTRCPIRRARLTNPEKPSARASGAAEVPRSRSCSPMVRSSTVPIGLVGPPSAGLAASARPA